MLWQCELRAVLWLARCCTVDWQWPPFINSREMIVLVFLCASTQCQWLPVVWKTVFITGVSIWHIDDNTSPWYFVSRAVTAVKLLLRSHFAAVLESDAVTQAGMWRGHSTCISDHIDVLHWTVDAVVLVMVLNCVLVGSVVLRTACVPWKAARTRGVCIHSQSCTTLLNPPCYFSKWPVTDVTD